MRRPDAADLAQGLARNAEAVCRRYLSNGCRKGRYWLIGDVHNTPGRSLFVRLTGPADGKDAAGRWTDAATGQHGDLLDIIRHAGGYSHFAQVVNEACRFLSLPATEPDHSSRQPGRPVTSGSPEAARRLFASARPITGTLAERYLNGRGLTAHHGTVALRFHPRCFHTAEDDGSPDTWPAMIAAVTDRNGALTGIQRTYLARVGSGKAPIDTPRRAMGELRGNAVRFGQVDDVMAAGEGIETVLSLHGALPLMPMVAALSASHLAALLFPTALRRLYIARDDDPAGHRAASILADRTRAEGIEPVLLSPRRKDFNDDLVALGADALRAGLRIQLAPEDVTRFMVLEKFPDRSD